MTITIVGGGNPSGPTYPLQRSVRLRGSASAYFSRSAYPVSGAGTKWTMSMWLKRGALSSQSDFFTFVSTTGSAQQAGIQFDSNGAIRWWQYAGAGGYQFQKVTTAVFRDPSAWYHIVFVYDTTLATATDRCQIWINGVRQTSFSTSTDPSLNLVTYYNTGTLYPYLGAENRNASSALNPFDGYLEEINFIDGQALTPTSFGAYNSFGVWSPAKYTGTYGTNGFYLNFQDNSGATATTIGKDSSGNNNNWTPNNISVTAGVTYDSMTDVPTLTSNTNANFATLNPLDTGSSATVANGNLSLTYNTTAWRVSRGTFGVSVGKWYWETLFTAGGTPNASQIGIVLAGASLTNFVGSSLGYSYSQSGQKIGNGATSAYGATYTSNDIIGIAFDADAGTITFYKNNVSQGTAFTGITGEYFPAFDAYNNSSWVVNFGQRPFSYTPPTGFKSLNTFNLPTPTIPNGAAYMAATTYTGNGTSQSITNTVNGVSFQPDWVWVKNRANGAADNILVDSVRGATNWMSSNLTAAEATNSAIVSSINSNGFSVGNANVTNQNATAIIGWQWKANGTPAVTNTSGSVPSTISANTTSGFSIVTFTCPASGNFTVGHGLGIAPAMFILKTRNGVDGWYVYHKNLATPASNYLVLNTTAATATSTSIWGNTNPTSSVLTLGTNAGIGANLNGLLYCFSEIAGFSKFGSYTGNGSTDGPFVYLGFRPRWVMIKRRDSVDNWFIWDSSRSAINVVNNVLFPDLANAEATGGAYLDFISNGFKLRETNSGRNANGGTYIYAAFAENPFNYSLAR